MAMGGAARNFEKPISIPFPFTRRKEISSAALFEGGGGGGRPSGITGIAQTRLETRAKIRNPDVSALCIDRPSFPILIFPLSLPRPIQYF